MLRSFGGPRGRGAAVGLLVAFAVGGLVGCHGRRIHKSAWLVTERDAARYIQEALEADSADVRRDALVQIGKTRFCGHDTVVKACGLIARTDRSASVRSAAIRVVSESMCAESASMLVRVLERDERTGNGGRVGGAGKNRDSSDVGVSADDRVLADALRGLYFLERNGAVDPAVQGEIVSAAVWHLSHGASRDVRIAAARVLGVYASVEAVDALVAALDDGDFGVVYHAERSLMRLTGVSHHHDTQAWRAWLAETDAPFAMRGRLNAKLEPPERLNWWQRMSKSMKRRMASFAPR